MQYRTPATATDITAVLERLDDLEHRLARLEHDVFGASDNARRLTHLETAVETLQATSGAVHDVLVGKGHPEPRRRRRAEVLDAPTNGATILAFPATAVGA